MRNFSPRQKFWAIGHTVSGDLHFNDKETGYVWLSYFSPGKFSNRFYATAKSPATTPAVVPFNAKGRLEFREISLGWLHYFKGSYRETKGWSLFGRAGFGLKFSKAENVFEPGVDTVDYQLPAFPVEGQHQFNRLVFDLGLGAEIPLGGNFYAYGEARTWLPASSYPSPVLHNNKNVPFPLIVGVGLRIFFDVFIESSHQSGLR